MHKIDQCENDVGKSSAGVSWLDDEVEVMGERPTAAPTFKPTKSPPVQNPRRGPELQQKPTQEGQYSETNPGTSGAKADAGTGTTKTAGLFKADASAL